MMKQRMTKLRSHQSLLSAILAFALVVVCMTIAYIVGLAILMVSLESPATSQSFLHGIKESWQNSETGTGIEGVFDAK